MGSINSRFQANGRKGLVVLTSSPSEERTVEESDGDDEEEEEDIFSARPRIEIFAKKYTRRRQQYTSSRLLLRTSNGMTGKLRPPRQQLCTKRLSKVAGDTHEEQSQNEYFDKKTQSFNHLERDAEKFRKRHHRTKLTLDKGQSRRKAAAAESCTSDCTCSSTTTTSSYSANFKESSSCPICLLEKRASSRKSE